MAIFKAKTKDALLSVLPIATIVLVLQFTLVPMDGGTLALFLSSTLSLIFGIGLFTLGADVAMMPMGEQIGSHLTKADRLYVLIPLTFLLGAMITAAEPDLHVLANQVPSVPKIVLILSVASGVGLFLVIAFLRILVKISFSRLLIVSYTLLFIMAAFTEADYLAVAFDSGGVTTGPITVPFILALGIGLSTVLGGKNSGENSFGLVALCSIGPIMAVMIMGLFYDASSSEYAETAILVPTDFMEYIALFLSSYKKFLIEVLIALSPILLFFAVFQMIAIKLAIRQLLKMAIGMLYTVAGLVLFLGGVNVGFMPVGRLIGETLAGRPDNWLLIPLAAVMGFFVVAAEPAVHVLNTQVKDMSGGAISRRAMMFSLSIGVAVSLALAMTRILFGVSIWYFLLPTYLLALILTRFSPSLFTAIAFDSGGVASGPVTATFLLPFAIGASEGVGGNILTDAFGLVAFVAMTPLVAIQLLGIVYKSRITWIEAEEDADLEQAESDSEELLEWYESHPKDNYYINLEE